MTKNNPLVSVVTICYNLEKEIEKTLKSVLNLDYDNYEYVIVDGDSQDNTIQIIKKYEKLFTNKNVPFNYISEKDKGIYDAMNKGVKMANGKWVNIMNGGDEFHPEFDMKEMFREPLDGHIYFGKSLSFYKDLKKVRFKNFHLDKSDWFISYMPNHQAVFIPKEFYNKESYDLTLNYCSDTNLLRKAFSELEYVYYDNFVSVFGIGGVSNYYGSFKKFKNILSDVSVVEKRFKRRIIVYLRHSIKFLFQVLLGRDRYLTLYFKRMLKEE